MSQSSRIVRSYLEEARRSACANSFYPRGTVRCANSSLFRSATARDVACLLDVDPDVTSWSCLPIELRAGSQYHVPDFEVICTDTRYLLDVDQAPLWVTEAAASAGYDYRLDTYDLEKLSQRLANARDLLRYATYNVSLGDKIRLLSLLDEYGPMSIKDCAPSIQNTSDPIGSIASMVLRRIVEMDLDDEPIGPDTRISRV